MKRDTTFWLGIFSTLCLCVSLSASHAIGAGSLRVSVAPSKTSTGEINVQLNDGSVNVDLLVDETESGIITIAPPDKPKATEEVRYTGDVTYNGPTHTGVVELTKDRFSFKRSKPGTWTETISVEFLAVREKYDERTGSWIEESDPVVFADASATIVFTVKAVELSISAKEYIPVKSDLNPGRHAITISASPKPSVGTITLTAAGGKLDLYKTATGGAAATTLTWNATDEYTAYMEGSAASAKVRDQTLEVKYSSAGTEPASAEVTVVAVSISAPRWTAKGKRENVALSYSPPNLDKDTIDLGGSATSLFEFYENVINEVTGEEEEQVAKKSWELPRDGSSISVVAEGKTPGDGKLEVMHAPSGAKAKVEAGVIEVDIILDGLGEDEEEYPGAFIGFKKRKSLVLKAEPKSAGGVVSLSLSTGLDLYDAEVNGNLITDREWSINSIPANLYVEGAISSNSVRDQECRLTYKSFFDVAKATVVSGNIAADSLPDFNTLKEEPPKPLPPKKAFVHWNIDNDDTVFWYPGADYKHRHVVKENDLKKMALSFTPDLDTGVIKLTVSNSNVRLWKSDKKGPSSTDASNRMSGNMVCQLNDVAAKRAFMNRKDNIYVEGYAKGSCDVVFSYVPPSGSEIELDRVTYHLIAATCGNQPKSERAMLSVESCFKNFKRGNENDFEWCISDETSNQTYNCIAFSAEITNAWIVPTVRNADGKFVAKIKDRGKLYYSLDKMYGNNNDQLDDEDFDGLYSKRLQAAYCPDKNAAQMDPDVKAVTYTRYHAAKRHPCNCGKEAGWIMFESKCGDWGKIEHRAVDAGVNCPDGYGSTSRFYK